VALVEQEALVHLIHFLVAQLLMLEAEVAEFLHLQDKLLALAVLVEVVAEEAQLVL
jgi:hypothetical protein